MDYSAFDIYLFSFIVSNYLAAWVRNKYFLSEEEKTTRLAKDIISKSGLHPEFVVPPAYFKQPKKVHKIYNLAMREGVSEDDYLFFIDDSENTSVQVEDDALLHIVATEYYNFLTFLLVQIAQRLQVGGTTNRGSNLFSLRFSVISYMFYKNMVFDSLSI